MAKCTQCNEENIFKKKLCARSDCPTKAVSPPQELQQEDTPDEILMQFAEEYGEAKRAEAIDLCLSQQRPGRSIRLSDGRVITLNEQQNEALDLMQEWLRDRNSLFFRLSGYAGTGKSTISREAIREYLNRGNSVAVSAPTHKAKKVIANATGLEAETIQSLLGLMPNVELADFDVNKPEFSQKKKPAIEYYRLIVLDEGSMLNKDLWEMLKVQCRRFNVKLLVMLDEAQLPPVKEDISPVIKDVDIEHHYRLTKVERQAGDNPLMLIYDAIRDNLTKEHDQFHHADDVIVFPGDTPKGHIFHNNLNKFGQEVVRAFQSEDFHEDPNYCKVICWTNQQVEFWNQSVRLTLKLALAKQRTPPEVMLHADVLMPDELLMAYSSYNESLQNSGEYKVINMQYDEKKIYWGDKKEYSSNIQGYRVALLDVDLRTVLNAFIVDPEIENIRKFTKVFSSYLFLAKTKRAWGNYYSFKAENLLMADIKDSAGHLVCKKDLDYAYAITVHKSQGSTFDQVFIDLADINKNRNWVERNKLKYVAFSRPRYLATIYTGAT